MLPSKYTSGDRPLICPYDRSHVILAKSFSSHLIKCRKHHKDVPMAVCRFDKTHVIPKPEKVHHESECSSQYLLDRERQRQAGDFGLRGDVEGPPIIADHQTAIDLEDWTVGPPATTPALFNKREPVENFIGPFMAESSNVHYPVVGQGIHSQSNQGDTSHGLPHSSSVAASMGASKGGAKNFPSSVFQFTSSSKHGKGSCATRESSDSRSTHFQNLSSPPKPSERGQFGEHKESNLPGSRTVDRNNSGVSIDTSVAAKGDEMQQNFPKGREQQLSQQLNHLKLLHKEEKEKMDQENQLSLHQMQKKFDEDRQRLMRKQEEQMMAMEQQFVELKTMIAQTTSPSAPPGFDPTQLSSPTNIGVHGKTSAAAMQKEISSGDKESWHEESSSATDGFDHVAQWLSHQHLDDIDDFGKGRLIQSVNQDEAESSSEPEPLKVKRKLEKKLRQINVLEQKASLGHRLSKPEEEKLDQKAAIISQLSALDCSP